MKILEDIDIKTKTLEDIVIRIAQWVKKHGPIKRNPPSQVDQLIADCRAISMPKDLRPREAVGWQILYHEDVLIVFAAWRTPEGKATLYQPDMQAVIAVFNLVSKGATIGEAVDTFMKDIE